MTGKSQDLYEKVFDYIETIFKLEPDSFMTDFETGMRAAIRKCYPQATLNGCWYHYCAALRRRLCSLQLLRIIAESKKARQIYRKMLSLPLLPKEQIRNGYLLIKQEARQNNVFTLFKSFFDYFDSFWLNLVRYWCHQEKLLFHFKKNQRNLLHSFFSERKRFNISGKPFYENYIILRVFQLEA